ncbi:hypothetical protein [Pseudomonas asplenii]|nr:hypothetical protein [Pseudomonas asplenii]
MSLEIPSKVEIERASYDEFGALWGQCRFGEQRLGQANDNKINNYY